MTGVALGFRAVFFVCSMSQSLGHQTHAHMVPRRTAPLDLCLLLLSLAFLLAPLGVSGHRPSQLKPFGKGEVIPIECQDPSGEQGWVPAATCSETGKPLSIRFGVEELLHCSWPIAIMEDYRRLAEVVSQKSSLQCRIPMTADQTFWLPLAIPFLGLVEPSHMHVNIHLSIVAHASSDGALMGVAVYPIRDRFQMVSPGTELNLHGTVRWFDRHSHKPLHSHSHQHSGQLSFVTIVLFCLITTIFNFVIGVVWYNAQVKPQLRRANLKID